MLLRLIDSISEFTFGNRLYVSTYIYKIDNQHSPFDFKAINIYYLKDDRFCRMLAVCASWDVYYFRILITSLAIGNARFEIEDRVNKFMRNAFNWWWLVFSIHKLNKIIRNMIVFRHSRYTQVKIMLSIHTAKKAHLWN